MRTRTRRRAEQANNTSQPKEATKRLHPRAGGSNPSRTRCVQLITNGSWDAAQRRVGSGRRAEDEAAAVSPGFVGLGTNGREENLQLFTRLDHGEKLLPGHDADASVREPRVGQRNQLDGL